MEFIDRFEVLTATDASRSFSELLHRVCYGGQSFIIKKGGRLMAKVTPVEPAAAEAATAEPPAVVTPKFEPEVPAPTPPAPAAKIFTPVAPEPVRPITTFDEAEYFSAVIDEQRKIPMPVDD